MPVRLSVLGAERTQESLENVAEQLHGRKMVQAMRRATLLVESVAKRKAPVDTGRLRASITSSIRTTGFLGNQLQGTIGTSVKYAPFMELGTGRPAGNAPTKFPPIQALEGWARRHGIPAYVVALTIFRRGGLEPRRYLQQALDTNRQKIVNILSNAVERIINES